MTIQGSCLCGALRFEVTGPLTSMVHCHCSRCRKFHGAPFATYATAHMGDLHWLAGEEQVVMQAAPPGGPRGFCRHCGSPAPTTHPPMGIAFIPVGLIEGDPGLLPQGHMFAGSKAPWYEITDELPRYPHYPPSFSDEPGLPDPAPPPVAPGRASGSCLCGEVAWDYGNPVAMFQCHCGRCRKARGAAHGANLFCGIDDFHWQRGAGLVTEYKLPEALRFTVAFCSRCGSSVPHVSQARAIAIIPASAMDTDPLIRPSGHIFTGTKAPWFEITGTMPQFAGYPPGFAPPPPADAG